VTLSRLGFAVFGIFALAFMALAEPAAAQSEDMLGTWKGEASQNAGTSGYTVILTLTETGATSDYPQLNCSGILTRVGAADGYVFYSEKIDQGGQYSGGTCIDGTVTIAPAEGRLAWGWVGSYGGEVYVAWANLVRE
jgi:hypothetical protein